MPWINGADAPIPVPLTKTTDPDNGVVTVTAWSSRFHIHLPTFGYEGEGGPVDAFFVAHPDLIPYRVDPDRLQRIYAGDDPENPSLTAALRFDTEAEARSVLAAWWADDPAKTVT